MVNSTRRTQKLRFGLKNLGSGDVRNRAGHRESIALSAWIFLHLPQVLPVAIHSKSAWVLPGLLWLWLFVHLQTEWSLNSQYNYGWAVPFLGALVLFQRWQRRPLAGVPGDGSVGPAIAIWLLLALLLPVRVVQEANPDWRLLGWVLAFDALGVTLLWILQTRGVAWLKHFAFPFCFLLVAVPWPVQLENAIVQAMMRSVASGAVEIAGWFGIGAYQLGNIIQLRNGFVGVDEACSGVKTLQAGIMVALVLGELLHLRRARRFGLLLLGCAWVFLCNVIRATALVFVAAQGGLESLSRWHDAIGTGALVAGMAGMLVLAWCWKSDLEMRSVRVASEMSAAPLHGHWFAVGWIIVVFGLSALWYRTHEHKLVARPPWNVSWPEANPGFKTLPIPESTRVILRYDQANSAQWEEPVGVHWWAFFAHWAPRRAALQLVRSHSPEICLPAIGRTFRGNRPTATVEVGEIVLGFRSYEFEQMGHPLFVFVCVQDDKRISSDRIDSDEWNVRGRLLAAWRGKRNLGQRLLEIALSGVDDFAAAVDALKSAAQLLVKRETPTG